MKNLFTICMVAAALVLSGCKYNDDDLWDAVSDQEERIAALETVGQQRNNEIAAISAIVTTL